MTKRKDLKGSRRSRKNQNTLPIGFFAGGVVIIIFAIIAGIQSGQNTVEAKFDYQTSDIVNDSPFIAVHEMGPSTLASVEFMPKDGPQPEIAVSEAFYDFGSIGAKAVARHDFIIANLGEAPLTIHRAYTTCGCTTAEFSASVIPPGKVVVMTLVLDAGFHDVSGQTVRRGVVIENNDPNNSQIEVWTQASVRNTP